MLRFVVRRMLLMVPVLFGLSVLLFVWVRPCPATRRGACWASRRRPSDRPGQRAVRLRPAAAAAVPHLHRRAAPGRLRHLAADRAAGAGAPSWTASRPPWSWPSRRCSSPSWSASRWATPPAKRAGGAAGHLRRRRLAARRGDPGVRAGVPAQAGLRGRPARPAGRAGRAALLGSAGPTDRRHPRHQLLRAGRPAHPGVGRRLGRHPAPDPAGASRSAASRWRSSSG